MAAVIVVAGALALATIAATVIWTSPDDATCAGLEAAIDRSGEEAPIHVIAIDLPSSDPAEVQAIVGDLGPTFDEGIRNGTRFVLRVDRGGDERIADDECMDGSRTFGVSRTNPKRQRNDQISAVQALQDHTETFLTAVKAGKTGGPLRLLRSSARTTSNYTRQGVEVSGVTVHSDFLGAGTNDCLDVTDVPPTQPGVDGIIERCTGVLPTFEVPLEVIGAGASTRSTGLEEFAGLLASAVCTSAAPGRCTTR